jgi:hypothetical protein
MDDAELQRALNDALSVSPSPHFVARVRTKIALAETAPLALQWFKVAAVAVSFAAIALFVVLRPGHIDVADANGILGSRPIAAAVLAPLVRPSRLLHSSMLANNARSFRAESSEMTEVLIDTDGRQALIDLMHSAVERRFEATFDETPTSRPWLMSELAIAPLTIEPLNPPAAENN